YFAMSCICCYFFFSSRRRHTRWPRDWSSDVCSSDLASRQIVLSVSAGWDATNARVRRYERASAEAPWVAAGDAVGGSLGRTGLRSEERRVGKECRSRWAPDE